MKRLSLLLIGILLFGFTSLHSQIPDYVPKTGLIGWWPFNGNAQDESGNGNHGVLMNNVKFIKDRFNDSSKAITLQGDSSYVVTSLKTIQSNSYTISCWFKTSEIMSNEIGLVVSRRAPFQSDGLYLSDTNGYIQCVTECDQAFHYNGKTEKYNDDKWHHFVSVFDGKKMFGYVDGKLFSIQNLEVTTCIVSPFEFGRDNPYGRYFKGDMDDIGIWNRALSEQEVKDLYDSKQVSSLIPDNVPKTGLIGWWPFNGNANDESGNGNHGTMIDGASNVADRFNRPNYALGLDGINDYVRLQYPFVDCVDFSISAWVLHTNKGNYSGILSDADGAINNDLFFNINNSEIGITADKSGRNLRSCNLQYYYGSFYNKGSFDSVWVHVVVTTTQNQTKIYINGELKGESNVGGSNVGYHNPNPVFGKNTDQGWSIQYFKGKLDDIGIWGRVLDSNEIKRLCNNESSTCSYSIKESDTTVCPESTLELNAIQTNPIKSDIPKNGLIGYWPFNGNANDESGNGNHGIVDGASITVDRCGKFNQAYLFNGVSSKITIKDNPILRPTSFTCAAWVYLEDDNNLNQILSKNAGDGNFESVDMVIHNGNGYNLLCNIGGPDYYGTWLTTPNKVQLNNWHLMTFIFDDLKDSIYSYIDEKLVAQSFETKSVTYDTLPWSFGSERENGEWSWYFKGKIDDIAIWNRPLTSSEISQVYNANSCNCEDTMSNDKFVWSDGQKGRKITIKPYTSTTYVLTVIDGATIHKDSIKVTIGGDSCITCIYGIKQTDTTICQGKTLELNASYDIHVDSIPKEGLVGWWPFNGNANDESGNGNNGIVDKAILTFGKENSPNSAYLFNKPGSKITIPDAQILNNKSLSLSFWVKSSNDSNSKNYIYKSQLLTANHEEYAIISPSSGTLEFAVKNQSNCAPGFGWNRNNVTKTLSDDQWHHVTATYDGIFSKIYVDTLLVSELQNSLFPIDSCPGGEILFGQGWDNDANLDGKLDDIAIWNRAISHAEVKIMYKLNKPKPGPKLPSDGLVGYWPFNGNAKDQTSFENHGTVKGATLTTDRCDRGNSAYEFNGIDNFIEVANSESLSNVESITMSAWILLDSLRNREQGILTKWFQLQDCDKNTDAYDLLISKSDNTGNIPKLVGATSRYFYYQNQSTDTITNSIWQHVLFVHDKNIGGKLYLDGEVVNIYSQNGSICSSTNPLYFGADNNFGKLWRFFDGKIDDIAIWNRPLSDSEVVQVYNAGSCNCIDTLPEDKFTWSTGQKGRKILVSPNASTMYTLEVERDNQIDRDTIHVKVLESPTPDIFGHIKVYERQVNYSYYTQLNDSSTYEWKITGNGKISSTNGGSSILIDFKEPGYAYLTVSETKKYGCRKDTTITIRIYGITDIHESTENNQALFIYPNPMNEFTSLDVKAYLPPSSRSYITISDMLGKTLQTIELGSQDSYSEVKAPVSTEGLSNGVYMIQLHVNGNVISDKVIINR